ncbi:signaling lymphocytic activation molecule-like isoform X1 [Phasianus colchicus]|uniref:signaling lymphocytic activation molecule-like isoform X1 n=1 Tax=Phasianus colchicus TaxID=9054 RepID=UPI00129D5950|nr:signaling lymphocytic activation molecule-like isoform X1 [Phasianus colchicus]
MGCRASLWLLISCCWVWGLGCGMMETVLGTLGKATVLGIPAHFQNLTQHFGTATWKRSVENPLSKEYLFTYNKGNYTNYKPGQILFHPSNFSLEILSTQRQDQQLYEYSVTTGAGEKNWQLRLAVYEPVSDPSIHILNWMLANDSCTVTLNCTAAQGDNVSYSWASSEASTSSLCTRNGSLLLLSYDPTNSNLPCACTASNPVSRRTAALHSSVCRSEEQGGWRTGMLLLGVVLPIMILIVLAGAFTVAHVAANMRQGREQSPLAEDSTVHTIYSQVQRVEKPKSPCSPLGTDHPSCTTIYTAATGTSLAPHSSQVSRKELRWFPPRSEHFAHPTLPCRAPARSL